MLPGLYQACGSLVGKKTPEQLGGASPLPTLAPAWLSALVCQGKLTVWVS